MPLPEGRKKYTKTKPMKFEEFTPLLAWWNNRTETAQSWNVPIETIIENNFNLDIKNPNAISTEDHRTPQEVVINILDKEKRIIQLIGEIEKDINKTLLAPSNYPCLKMKDVTTLVKRKVEINPLGRVKSLGIKLWGKGAYIAEEKDASELRADRFLVKVNDVVYNDMWARSGSVAIVPQELDGFFVSAHFPTWELNLNIVYPPFFTWCFRAPWFWKVCEEMAQGSTGRNAITKPGFRDITMPIPSLDTQKKIVTELNKLQEKIDELELLQAAVDHDRETLVPAVLAKAFGGEILS